MTRLTISLSDSRYRALKEASARRDKTIGELIDESLELNGIKPVEDVLSLVREARAQANLSEDEALSLAVEETRKVRATR